MRRRGVAGRLQLALQAHAAGVSAGCTASRISSAHQRRRRKRATSQRRHEQRRGDQRTGDAEEDDAKLVGGYRSDIGRPAAQVERQPDGVGDHQRHQLGG